MQEDLHGRVAQAKPRWTRATLLLRVVAEPLDRAVMAAAAGLQVAA